MRTQAIALAVLVCSGAVLAQNPLGDDSGPNAHDGQCDDTRFENIGTGNSNVVFWEGGRYDGRDATDCRDLLLQGLINWRDGVDPRVDTVLATGDFGDDSGPNANDGQCDDARFENNGAGNSNIVFWEGGRYDGRDATDCADLLLQGLIAWRRDTAVAEVPGESEVSTVSEAQQQEAPTLPEGVTAESVCTDNPEGQACWMELDNIDGCYIWNPNPQQNETVIWSGHCSGGLVDGTGTVTWTYGTNGENTSTDPPGPYQYGKPHGTWIVRNDNGDVFETPYVNGERHGTQIERQADGDVFENSYVNGVEHGKAVARLVDGTVREVPVVNGEIHGTQIDRQADGDVIETPWVNGERHGTQVVRWVNGSVSEIPYVNGERHGTEYGRYPNGYVVEEIPWVDGQKHGTEVLRTADGGQIETPWVNGQISGTQIELSSDGGSRETPYLDGEKHGTEIVRRPYFDEGDRIVETPWVNGQRHGIQITLTPVAGREPSRKETPWINDRIHGTEISNSTFLGAITRTPWVNGVKHGLQTADFQGLGQTQVRWINGKRQGTATTVWGRDPDRGLDRRIGTVCYRDDEMIKGSEYELNAPC